MTTTMDKNHIIQRVLEDPRVRIGTARQSFEWFFNLYLNKFITYETAPFQKKMFEIAENEQELLSIIVSFRGSAKTTIMALAYPIWAILGRQHKKFVVIICDTQELARQRLANIRSQFEHNALLQRELGPFQDDSGQWGAGSVVLPKYDARITVASREQSIRGITHNEHRPDLIILDDVENIEIVRTKEGRDKLDRWFHDDILPLGSLKTKVVVIGNLLHEDSLIMRQKELIQTGKMSGGYYQFPVRIGKRILWPGKYPDMRTIERERKKLGNERSWLREFELKIIPEEDQVILPEWIQRYDHLPDGEPSVEFIAVATGIDPALSQKNRADYTAMVSIRVYRQGDTVYFYVLPRPVNERLTFNGQIERAMEVSLRVGGGNKTKLCVEKVAYQGALTEALRKKNYPAIDALTGGADKRTRLMTISPYLENSLVLFPRHGAEDLISQLLGFGVERHDDLMDAFTIAMNELSKYDRPPTRWPNQGGNNSNNRPYFAGILTERF